MFGGAIRATSRSKGFVKLPEAYTNMGHLGLAKKQYADALRMYELAGRLNQQRDVKVGRAVALAKGVADRAGLYSRLHRHRQHQSRAIPWGSAVDRPCRCRPCIVVSRWDWATSLVEFQSNC